MFLLQKKYLKPIQEFWKTKYDLIIFDNNPIEQNKVEWKKLSTCFCEKNTFPKNKFGFITRL